MTEGTNTQNTEYLDGFQYTQEALDFFPHKEGYVKITPTDNGIPSFNYVFTYTDHLEGGALKNSPVGCFSERASLSRWQGLRYTKTETQGLAILEEDHYYPFGLKHNGYNSDHKIFEFNDGTNTVVLTPVTPSRKETYKYKYNGKENQDEFGLNMYAMDMRMYDSAIARWVVQDPVVHFDYSTYSAFDNNPVFWADPSGADSVDMWGRNTHDENGIYIPYSMRGATSSSEGSTDSNNTEEECPSCNNRNILIDFIRTAAYESGEELANIEIHYAANPFDPEVRDRELSKSVRVKNMIFILGNNNLVYKNGLQNLRKYIFAGTLDRNRYEFKQTFELKMADGSYKNFSADGTIYLKQDPSDMNLRYLGYADSGAGLNWGHVIKFYNDKSEIIASLSFNSQNLLDGFIKQNFINIRTRRKNEIIKEHFKTKN
jgi:RHS repeat-associated protein